LTTINATAMVAGTIIGASIFVQPSELARHLGTPASIMAAWIICGILTLFGALICAELASAFPHTGGLYVFLRETFSPLAGFLWGWAMFWTMHTGIVAAIAMVFARYAAVFVPAGDRGVRAIAIVVVLAVSALNYFGVRAGSRVQTAFTVVKLGAIVMLVLGGAVLGGDATTAKLAAPAQSGESITGFLLALVAGLFAYGGWHMVTYTAGETKMPARTIPIALLSGVAIVTAAYVSLNLVYLAVLPLDTVRISTRVAADAADAVLGRGGSGLLAVLVMVSSLGALVGIVLTGPRVYYSMAQDGLAFRWLTHVHPKYQTPDRAIVAQAVWATVLVATGVYRDLFTRVIYTEWLFFALMATGLFVLRRRADYDPPYRTWGYPAIPVVFIIASLIIVANQIASEPLDAAAGLALVAAGIPVYHLAHARR
jgi:APA family basic amino acid/polyamine antiporter